MLEFSGRLKAILAIAAIWIAASVAIYFLLVDESTSVQKAALAYLILSEVLTAAVFAYIELKRGHDSARIGFSVATALYFILAAGAALVHLGGLVVTAVWLHIIEILLLAPLATILILLGRGTHEVALGDQAKFRQASTLQSVLSRLEAISIAPGLEEPDRVILKNLADYFKYFDKAPAPSDAAIESKVKELEALLASKAKASGDGGSLGGLVDELHNLIHLRRQESQGQRRGGF